MSEPVVPIEEAESDGEDAPSGDRRIRNPYISFVVSVLWAAGASLSVYCIFRAAAWGAERLNDWLPLKDTAPAEFLAAVLGWGSAIAAAAIFCLITFYQLIILQRRLKESYDREY